jgi:hypothetical protein
VSALLERDAEGEGQGKGKKPPLPPPEPPPPLPDAPDHILTRADVFAMAALVGWDAARVEAGLRGYFASRAGIATLAKAPGVYEEGGGAMVPMTADQATADLLEEVAAERRRRGV